MAKARARCLPMNLKASDVIGVLKDRERARERNTIGTSLADVDPMAIDSKVFLKLLISYLLLLVLAVPKLCTN